MECDFEVQVRVGVHVASCWGNGEVLGELRRVPLKVGLDISEITHLQSLAQSAILDDLAE